MQTNLYWQKARQWFLVMENDPWEVEGRDDKELHHNTLKSDGHTYYLLLTASYMYTLCYKTERYTLNMQFIDKILALIKLENNKSTQFIVLFNVL